MVPFVRRASHSRKAWHENDSDADPNWIDREEPEQYESALENDGLYGAGAVELVLTKLLTQELSDLAGSCSALL